MLCLIFMTACNKSKSSQVPVYQGMTISRTATTAGDDSWDNGKYKKYDPEDGYDGGHWIVENLVRVWVDKHGNKYWRLADGRLHHRHHPGCQHGDYDGRNDDIDVEEVIEENIEAIEETVESTLEVVGAVESIYYATTNQDMYITIHILNPDAFEIVSFTLNGQKYTSYMFEQGSDLENLILRVNAGDVPGIKEYTIDAIKYIEGTEIKDVRMDGDKTVKAGIYTDNMVSAALANEETTLTTLSFGATLRDNYGLIEKSGGFVKAYLYDGNNIVEKPLVLGNNTVSFDNLTPNTLYPYAVVAYYDDLTGNGADVHILASGAMYTNTIVLFKDIVTTQTSISWDYEWESSFENKTITSLALYKGEEKLRDLDADAKSVDELLCNNQYKIVATYKNVNDQDETIMILVTTLDKAMPSVTISGDNVTGDAITATLTMTDEDNVGTLVSVQLFSGENLVATNAQNEINFTGLDSYTDYKVVVNYSYNLNDGAGVQNAKEEKEYKTSPHLEFTNCRIINTSAVSEGETIYMQVSLTNPSGAIPKSVVVNGRSYNCTNSTTASKIYVEIVYDGQFDGGDTELTVERVNMTLGGKDYAIEPTTNNSD
ncbi:MAG: hypothetical protein J5815_02015, partial [Clostridia bacterium]|nr:hypothetical protein [Clostridia bacterium]